MTIFRRIIGAAVALAMALCVGQPARATIIYSENFDSTTVGTLPAGWAGITSGTWSVTNALSVSSPNALIGPVTGGDGKMILYTGQSAIADMEIRYDCAINQAFVSPLVRMSADGQNGYLVLANNTSNANGTWTFFKRVGGSFTSLDTAAFSGLSGPVSVRLRIQGSTISLKVWSYGTAEPSSFQKVITDTSVTAAGYPGFYNQGLTADGGSSVVDNFTLDNLAVALTPGTSSSSGIGPTTATVTNTGASGGTPAYSYQWYRSTTSGFTPGAGNIVSGATSLTLNDTGLTPSTTYYYVLKVTDSASATALATQLSVTTASNALTNGSLSSSGITSTTATVVDSGATGGSTPYHYQWYRSTTTGFTPGGGNIVSGATSATLNDTGLTPSTTYYYKNIVTDNASATATSSQLSLTTSAGSNVVPVTNSNIFWPPGSWDHLTSGTFGVSVDTMQATAPGPGPKFNVTGTVNLSIGIDNATTSGFPSGNMPIVRYSIDNAPFVDVQLAPAQTSLVLSNSLSTGGHSVELYFKASSSSSGYADVWGSSGVSPTNVLRINGITVDLGGSVTAPTLLSGRGMIFGDSIGAGEHLNTDGSDDSTQSFAPILARALGIEFGQLGYGGQGWEVGGGSNIPAFKTAFGNYSAGRARSFSGLDFIAIVEGTNDARGAVSGSTVQADEVSTLTSLRAAAGSSTNILVIVPPAGSYASNLSAGVVAYKASSGDQHVYFIDATALLPSGVFTTSFGSLTQWTYDGVHPLIYGNARIAAAYAAKVIAALTPANSNTFRRQGTSGGFQQ